MSENKVFRNIDSNQSDHLSIYMSIVCEFLETETLQNNKNNNNTVKIKWEETGKDYYSTLVKETVTEIDKSLDLEIKSNLEMAIQGFKDILIKTAQQTTKTSRKITRKPKLKVWTPEISNVLQRVRTVNKQILNTEKLNINETQILQERKHLKMNLDKHAEI